MGFKRLILFVIVVVGLAIISKTQRFENWLNTFILNPSMSDQMDHTSVEERRAFRFGNLYSLCQYAKKTINSDSAHKPQDAVILLPPNDFLREQKIDGFHFPEPIEFYYHTGLKSVWTSSPNVEDANWTFVPQAKGSMALVPISKDELHKLLESYKKYKATL